MTTPPTFDDLFSDIFPRTASAQPAAPDLLSGLFARPAAPSPQRHVQDETHFSLRGVRYDLSDFTFEVMTTDHYRELCSIRPLSGNSHLAYHFLNPQTGKVMHFSSNEVSHEQVMTALSRGWQVYAALLSHDPATPNKLDTLCRILPAPQHDMEKLIAQLGL
ncbi:MAG: hypothetical protein Q4C89_10180 [Deinococcus sp.]|uniref:hypothetical protein n=1 Tax=Deinococcus sp. TaxID=47478 RepID=UPI0026DB543E|nr:hypothetical protein [Deinococcus sp.]MDO4246379.1 hypothetical protein [Deinococcus sp.]